MRCKWNFMFVVVCLATAGCGAAIKSADDERNPPIPSVNDRAGDEAADDPDAFKVRLKTTKGDVVIEVHPSWSPNGAKRFRELVEAGFYDDVRFFRVLDDFMAQVGINGDPDVHAKWKDKNIRDDRPGRQSNKRGYVTFAKTGAPHSRSTQIFINYGDNSSLDRQGFTPFGKVVEGMEVVDKLYSGYGEGAPKGNGPDQGMIVEMGNKYLDKSFPKLDSIEKAEVVGAEKSDKAKSKDKPDDDKDQ